MQYKTFLLYYREANLLRESLIPCKDAVKDDSHFFQLSVYPEGRMYREGKERIIT